MAAQREGLEASSIACSVFADSVESDLTKYRDFGKDISEQKAERILRRGVRHANEAVIKRAEESKELSGMGTTLVAVLILGTEVYAVNVGDSRLYLLTDSHAEQITHDHSYVQFLVDIGRISEDEAKQSSNRNIITRAVGTSIDTEPDFFTVNTVEHACILLCTDGLTNMLSADDIANHLSGDTSDEATLSSVCRALVDSANESGGHDNITAVIVSL